MAAHDEVRAEAVGCTRCGLAEGRTRVVFGVGDVHAPLMLVGEAPGHHEDQQGEPFVGRAGRLLDELLGEVGLARGDGVYITNVLKCRPPGNRDPRPDEIAACRPWLAAQLDLVDPQVVVSVGAFATRLLLRDCDGGPPDPAAVPVSRVAGWRFDLGGRTLVPTYHPAAALRGNQRALASLRHDLRLAADVLAGTVPSAREELARRDGPAGEPVAGPGRADADEHGGADAGDEGDGGGQLRLL